MEDPNEVQKRTCLVCHLVCVSVVAKRKHESRDCRKNIDEHLEDMNQRKRFKCHYCDNTYVKKDKAKYHEKYQCTLAKLHASLEERDRMDHQPTNENINSLNQSRDGPVKLVG